MRLNERRPGFCERRYRSVRLSQYAGIVEMGGRVLEVLPKVSQSPPPHECRGVLLRLLKASRAIPGMSEASIAQHVSSGSLLEVFINAFFETVLTQVKAGL